MRSALVLLFGKVAIAVLLFTGITSASPHFTGNVPTLQNFTDDTTTILSVFREPGQNFTYEIHPGGLTIKIRPNDVGENHILDNLEVSGLENGKTYQLKIKDQTGKIIDGSEFQSLDSNLENPKTAICSCSRIGILSPDDKIKPMWNRVMEQKPDAILFLGDIVYGDNAVQAVLKFLFGYHPTFIQIQKRFIQSWKKEKLYRQPKLIPLFSVWDDHDFGYEEADKFNPFKKAMVKLFRSYYPIPQDKTRLEYGPGVAYSYRLFGRKILMLDNRSFNSVKEKTLLGMEQIKWIEQQVKGEKEVIIASGMSIIDNGPLHKSVQRKSPKEWAEFRNIFLKEPVKAVFVTGDVHYSEVRVVPEHVLGFKTFQIVSSPVKSTSSFITPPFQSGKSKDPLQVLHVNGYNFAMLSMGSLFKNLEIIYHRGKNKPPVELISSFENNSCRHYYSVAN